jgi:hypothetical protein
MRFVKSGNFETIMGISAPDAVLLSEACEIAATEVTSREREGDLQRLETFKALFDAMALLGVTQYTFPLDKLEDLQQVAAEYGLDGLLDRRELRRGK